MEYCQTRVSQCRRVISEKRTLAIPTQAVKIMGAIHGMPLPGPKLVHANPNNPMASRGMTV